MARSNGISVWIAAPLCAAALVSMPARAEDSLFDKPAAQSPAPEAPKPATEPAPKPAAAPELAAAPKPKHVAAKPKPAHKPKPTEAASVPATPAPLPPVVVQEPAPEPQRAFGQEMPQQSLINRFMNPASANGQVGPDGKPAAPAPEEETLPNGMPKKFLLNRLFDFQRARARKPRSAQFHGAGAAGRLRTGARQLVDNATKTLGFGGKQDAPSGNLPPVNVTAPANRNASPQPPAPAAVAPPAEPSWFDRATGSMGLGGDDKTVPDYSERPKLVAPHNLDALPPPNPREERRVLPPANAEALTKPPPSFMEKARGADGNVSGFTDQDAGKKGWFNWF